MRTLFSVAGPVATITLNRPEAMNAIDAEMRVAIVEACNRVRTAEDIRVLILTRTGKAFCTGSDLKNTMPPDDSYARATFGGESDKSLADLIELDKPVVCAINGYALAGGLELALACDIRIAAAEAKFGLPEVVIGSIPGAGGTQRLPRMVGMSNALHMMLTGERVDSADALRMGIVSKVVPAETLMAEANAIAEKIAANAPLAVRAVKRLVHHGADLHLKAAIEAERMAWGVLRNTEDRIEGRNAFKEKRKPVYRGV